MQRFYYSTTGASLSTQNGQIILLPVTGDLNNVDGRTLLVVALHDLTGEHCLARDHGWRLYVMPGGGVELQCNAGVDGPANGTRYVAGYAQLQAAGIVLQQGQAHYFYIDPINIDRTPQTEVQLYIDAKLVSFSKYEASYFNEFRIRPRAIGGHQTQSSADFTIFEYIKTRRTYVQDVDGTPQQFAVPPWTLTEQRLLVNAGRGVDLPQFAGLYAHVLQHFRFQAKRYANDSFSPLRGDSSAQYFSSAYRSEYQDTTTLTFDGIDDQLASGPDKGLATPGDLTYDFEAMPYVQGMPANAGASNTLSFNQTALRTLLNGAQYFAGTDACAVWLMVLTDGIALGVAGREGPFGSFFQTLIFYPIALSNTEYTRIGISFSNRYPSLYLNGSLVLTGTQAPYPVYAGLEVGRRYANGTEGKTYAGRLRNFQLWSYARTAGQLGQTFNHSPQAGLELSYNFARPAANSTMIQDFSGYARHASLEGFVLAPVVQGFKRRAGRQLYN